MSEDQKLHQVAKKIFEKMMAYPSPYGFNFSYSPERSWDGRAEYLFLTINPQAKEHDKLVTKQILWPEDNDFFTENDNNTFQIKKPVQAICYELSRLAHIRECEKASPLEAAKIFTNNHMILASFVPFRTENEKDIDENMKQFAQNEYWGEIFKV
ncbi:MAG: hypothetical protein J1E80_07220 [Desulfovibrionaceae bacterium]|nr:hypothetical protein [Desulfovibrionaceae bacterium]